MRRSSRDQRPRCMRSMPCPFGSGGCSTMVTRLSPPQPSPGSAGGEACGLDAGERSHAGEELLEEGDLLRGLFVVRVGKTEAEG